MENLWIAVYFSGPRKAFFRQKELLMFKTSSEPSSLVDQPVDTVQVKKK